MIAAIITLSQDKKENVYIMGIKFPTYHYLVKIDKFTAESIGKKQNITIQQIKN